MGRILAQFWIMAFLLVFVTTGRVEARGIAGRELAETVTRADKALKLNGVGLREKYYFDIYVLGAYTESGTCDPARMIKDDEVKLLRMEFVRSVPAKRLQAEVRKMVSSRLPVSATDADRQQSESFIAMYDFDVTKETIVELLYVPGTGVTATRDGRPMGAVLPGKSLLETLWSTYVGPDPCCPATRRQLLESCQPM
jgi:hypothetical protein